MDKFQVEFASVLKARREARLRRTALYSPYTQQRQVKYVPTTDSPNYPTQTWFPNLGPASAHQYIRNEPAVESLRPYPIYPVSPWPPIIYDPGKGDATFDPSRQEREVRSPSAPAVGESLTTKNTQGWGDSMFLDENSPPQFPGLRKYRKVKEEDEGD